MEVVMIPAKTVVTINGVPVALAVDTLVEVEYANMCYLTGYHYAHLPEAPTGYVETVDMAAAVAENPGPA